MKTLLFCTSYAENQGTWNERWGRWLKTVVHSGLKADQILIVDDGSPVLPDWPGVSVMPAASPKRWRHERSDPSLPGPARAEGQWRTVSLDGTVRSLMLCFMQ